MTFFLYLVITLLALSKTSTLYNYPPISLSKVEINQERKFNHSEEKSSNMVFIDMCQELLRFITERTKVIEGHGISFSSEIFNSIQQKAYNQQVEYENLKTESNAYLKKTLDKRPDKKTGSRIESHIADGIELSTKYLSMPDDQWDLLGEVENIKVWKCKHPINPPYTAGAEKWPCIKATAIIDAAPRALMHLLMDSSKVSLTNKFSAGRFDIECIDKNTKIVWNRSRIPYTIKPYDFCSLMYSYEVIFIFHPLLFLDLKYIIT